MRKKSESRMVGCNLAPPLYDYLSLYHLVTGESKSKTIRKVLHNWWTGCIQTFSIESQINTLIERYQMDWDVLKLKNSKVTFPEYINQLTEKLNRTLIDKTIIRKILKGINS